MADYDKAAFDRWLTTQPDSEEDLVNLLGVNTAALDAVFQGTPIRYMLGIAEECGEVIGAYNKYSGRRTDKPKNKYQIAGEMAQLIGCIFLAANNMGFSVQYMLDQTNEWLSAKANT